MTDATRTQADGPISAPEEVRSVSSSAYRRTGAVFAPAPCVVVLGMHRSGTSAVTAAIAQLGLALPGGDDLMGPAPDNPRGHYESRSLTDVDDRLLAFLGGSWDRPPLLEPGWHDDPSLDELASEAAAAFAAAYPDGTRTALWKDPRLSLLLPFWRRVLDRPLATVLVIREPEEIAHSLAVRDGFPVVRGLALYERYLRSALANLSGQPVHVVRYPDLLNDTAPFTKDVARFLEDSGVDVTSADDVELSSTVDASLRHPLLGDELAGAARLVLSEQRGLASLLDGLVGSHPELAPPGNLGEESAWASSLLALERDLGHVFHGLVWATRQMEPLVRMTPRPTPSDSGLEKKDDPTEDGLEASEPDEKGPYPLNASEDRRAYHRWLTARRLPVVVGGASDPPRRRAVTRAPFRRRAPLISLLVPVWHTPIWVLERCVSSVLAQRFGDWELCLCDDASGDPELTAYLRSIQRIDRRIHTTALAGNGGISAATNGALALTRGRFVAFLDHDDELTPDALEAAAAAIEAEPDGDVFYSDEDKIDASGERFDPLFKPDWSPDLLLSFQYLGHLTIMRRALVAELGGLRSDYDGSQDYDLALRATEKARKIVHIPEVLYHWRTLPGSAASDSSGVVAKPWAYEAGLRAIEDALQRRGEDAEVTKEPRFAGRYHVRRALTSRPLVSVIIPFRDEPALLATCCESLRANPGYDRVELVLVDNGSELPETAALLDRLGRDPDVKILDAPGPFNWAAINNNAVREAKGEILLFSNNDIEARAPRWLHAMLGHALRPEVGAVGARLLYPDGDIQHAGVVVGLGGIAGHVLRGLPGEHPGYNSMAFQTRNCSVVTGACMMTRREVFDSVGGFDEHLPVAFNDVDYCLKLREKDFLVVYTPLAELIHHESRSRGHTDDLVESRRILERWAEVIIAGDPYLNTHLSHWRYWCPLSTAQEDDRWKTYLETSVSTRGRSSSI
jgi:GT2 family glycosyltransferase